MSLQFVLGGSGSGKTEYMFSEIVREASKHPAKNYLIIVPEQFTMQTQKTLVELAPNHAIMNIDVLSFKRLAYRVFDDLGIQTIRVLEETGKNLVLRKVAGEKEKELTVLRANMGRMGYIEEIKSFISELVQYNISPEQLEAYCIEGKAAPSFCAKLKDIVTMYRGFKDYLKDSYVTAEEILNLLICECERSALLQGSVIVFDEFTGFTPIQNRLMEKLLSMAESIHILLTMDADEDPYTCGGEHELFYLSKKTIMSVTRMANDLDVPVLAPVVLSDSKQKRFAASFDMAFLEQNLFRAWYKRSLSKVQNIHVTSLRNPREELTYVAREINRMVRSGKRRYKDIAVVTGAVDSYGNYVDEIFGKYGIPYFLDQTTEILYHPFIEFIRAALEVVEQDYSYESVMRLLRCGFFPMEEDTIDRLDNYLLASGIRGRKAWNRRWLYMPKGYTLLDSAGLEELRISVTARIEPLCEVFLDQKSTASEEIRALYAFLLDVECERQLWQKEAEFTAKGALVKAKEYGQIYRIVMELLEKYESLLGTEVMDIEEFAQILDAGLSAANVAALPPGYDTVTIGDIERTRLNGIKVLFFVGVNDGIIPKSDNRGGIISEYERQMLQEAQMELAPGAREQAFIQRFYLYRNLTKPSEELYISFSRVDASGKSVRPSYLVSTITKLFPQLQVEEIEDVQEQVNLSTPASALDYLIHGAKDETWYVLAKYFGADAERILSAPYYHYAHEPISRIVAQSLYGHQMEGSVTRLEKFASCAYAHFLQYGLKLRERMESSFASVDMGNLYHEALERFGRKIEASAFDWFTLPKEVREQFAEEAMAEALEGYPNMSVYATGENAHMTKRMEDIFLQTTWALVEQVKAGSFAPEDFEISFSKVNGLETLKLLLNDGERMYLSGKIDRLDAYQEDNRLYVKIIDYKSGSTKFDLIRIYRGLSLQLVVYMNAALELEKAKHPDLDVQPAAILYYHIDDPVLDALPKMSEQADADGQEQYADALLLALRPDGLVASEETIYRAMDHDFEKKSRVIPVELKSDASISQARSKVASAEEFEVIGAYVKLQLQELGQQIYDGNVAVNPYRDGKETGCDYCPYAGVCGRDGKIPGYEYRDLETVEKAEVITRMQTDLARKEHRNG